MAKKGVQRVPLPTALRFEIVNGQKFVALREAAKLANIHPTALEMGQALLASVDNGAAQFALSDVTMQDGDQLLRVFKGQLRKVAKVFAPSKRIRVKGMRQGNRLSFWFVGA